MKTLHSDKFVCPQLRGQGKQFFDLMKSELFGWSSKQGDVMGMLLLSSVCYCRRINTAPEFKEMICFTFKFNTESKQTAKAKTTSEQVGEF